MRAKEYYDKYMLAIFHEASVNKTSVARQLCQDLCTETIDLIAKSKSDSDSSVLGICKQQCQKFDVIAGYFERDFGKPILRKGSFPTVLVKYIPELKGKLKTS